MTDAVTEVGIGSAAPPEGADGPALMTQKQLEAMTGIAGSTWAHWRMTRKNLPFLKVGRRVYYSRRDVVEWLAKCRQEARDASAA